MSTHTTMPVREQITPHGMVSLSSRWTHDRYYLMASGSFEAILWLFPQMKGIPEHHGDRYRHVFAPGSSPITVERVLRRLCSEWQEEWNRMYEDYLSGVQSSAANAEVRVSLETLGKLFDHLYAKRQSTIAKSTTSRDKYRLKVWRDQLGDNLPLSALTEECIAAALAAIGKRTSACTANAAFGVLKTYLNWAANKGWMKDRCHSTVKRLREDAAETHHRLWWTTAEVNHALKVAEKDPHQPTAHLLVAAGCLLGLRVEEIVMLRWRDLSLDSVDPVSREPRPVCHIMPRAEWQPKDGEKRDIPICWQLLSILRQYQKGDGYLLEAEPHRQGRSRISTGWVYRYDPRKVWLRIMERLVAEGGKAITMYGMRHSFASNLLIAGISDVKVGRWLGHADTRMVHRHYGHLLSYDGDINALQGPGSRAGSA
jgi:integrase